MRELGIYQENQLYHHWQNLGYTTVFLANEKEILAGIALEDTIKPDAKKAISALQESGIEIVMLTGDNHKTAQKVAFELGITQFKAEVLPSDKSKIVREFQQKGNVVGMVGDGINDSEALAQADVSIAMSKGSDVAMDVAKITLISDQLTKISEVINLSKRTQSIIQQNLFWAFIYNIIGIPIAAGVLFPINGFLMNPMLAGAAMAFSSVSVVTNSLRLKK
jgi:Cu2+-exporting ATPase